ncbi:uncharacterized protein BXZ73DRAFT_105663 [Epithele typhae]|uniref:uncharacterized protein n=1 Tax=Epithele typhae TaxID=378194 RepID=UPI0020082EA5|nr:uncharacterized protein BXZ73DRAFT_105663 [Epithele typhae]KAH9916969.1 hypothetical protein BXZ73DRAFT_105663 [Epithele typhae]
MPPEPPSESTSPQSLRSQIAFITTFLNLARPADGKSYYNKKYDRKAGAWHVASFILATGDGKTDRVGSKVVAVTDRRSREEINVLLSRNVSQNADASRTSPSPFSRPFEGHSDDGYGILYNITHGKKKDFAVKFEDHIQDVVNVAQYFFKLSPAEVRRGHRSFLLAFIALRCCVKLAFRIRTGKLMWHFEPKQHPTAFIHSKLADPDTKLHISLARWLPCPLEEGYNFYPVTRENASEWAQLLQQSVDTMDSVLKKIKEGDATTQLFLDFENAVSLLKFLVRSGVLKHIVAGDIKGDLDKARRVKCSDLETIIRESNKKRASADQTFGQGVEPSLEKDESFLEADEYAAETLYIPGDIADVFMKLPSPTDPPHVTAVLWTPSRRWMTERA